MADISKCYGYGCGKATKCFRYTANSGMMQSYLMDSPMNDDGTCDYFLSNGDE